MLAQAVGYEIPIISNKIVEDYFNFPKIVLLAPRLIPT